MGNELAEVAPTRRRPTRAIVIAAVEHVYLEYLANISAGDSDFARKPVPTARVVMCVGAVQSRNAPWTGSGCATLAEYRLDDLARISGVTARNIRAYRERGLLDPPRRVGRS